MSDRSHVLPAPEGEYFENARFNGLSLLCGLLGIVGLVLSFIGAFISPVQFSFSWLFAFFFFFTLCIGCLFWIIVHHVVDAEWSVVVRRQLENIALLLPVMGVLFVDAKGEPSCLFTVVTRRGWCGDRRCRWLRSMKCACG